MKTKLLVWITIFFSWVGVAGQLQTLRLADGTKLTFLGLTVGSHHVAPHYEKFVGNNEIETPENTAVVWIEAEHDSAKWPNYEVLVYDQSNTACVNIEQSHASTHVKDGVDIHGFVLNAFPRWDRETVLRIRPFGGAVSKEQFVIANPERSGSESWIPKPLPDTESDGDLEVTLTKLIAAAPAPYRQGGEPAPTPDPANQCVRLDFVFREHGQSSTNWQPWPVRTSDAFGNQVRGFIYDYPTNGFYPTSPERLHPSIASQTDGFFYRPGLWPDEPAWKVRMELIRRAGFGDDEIVTFTNLLIRPGSQQDLDDEWTWDARNTNFTFIAQGKVNGVNLKLLPPLLAPDPDHAGSKRLSVIIFADANFDPRGMNLTLLRATDDQGHDIWSPSGSAWAGHYSLEFPNVREVQTVSLKLALHKNRFVEFTVKPTKR